MPKKRESHVTSVRLKREGVDLKPALQEEAFQLERPLGWLIYKILQNHVKKSKK